MQHPGKHGLGTGTGRDKARSTGRTCVDGESGLAGCRTPEWARVKSSRRSGPEPEAERCFTFPIGDESERRGWQRKPKMSDMEM